MTSASGKHPPEHGFQRMHLGQDPGGGLGTTVICTFVKDAGRRYLLIDNGAESVFGLTTAEMFGRTDEELFSGAEHPDTRQAEIRVLAGETVVTREARYLEGQRLSFDVLRKPLFGDGGAASGLCGLVRSHDAELRLVKKLSQLQMLESLGLLTEGIARYFNSLLMKLQGQVSLMLLEIDDTLEKQVIEGTALTRRLLELASTQVHQLGPLDLNEVVREVAATIESAHPGVEVARDLQRPLPMIEADRGLIEQALLSLALNSVEAMSGSGRLTFTTAVASDTARREDSPETPSTSPPSGDPSTFPPSGDPSTSPPSGDLVLLRVTDTGTGLEEEEMERAFEPFFTTKGTSHASGLGLTSVRRIVDVHGGSISFDAPGGAGCSISVLLPAFVSAAPDQVEKEADSAAEAAGGTILLVDDEKTILNVQSQMLRRLGFVVFEASGGRPAVEIFGRRHREIDLVVIDVTMPDLGGVEALEQMERITPGIRALFVSGWSKPAPLREKLRAGRHSFIEKPVKFQQLSRKIRELLDRPDVD